MTVEKLKDFHRRRLVVLADAGPDLLALETIPCKLETQVSFYSVLPI
jgi:homocysteine S-methyltransferase